MERRRFNVGLGWMSEREARRTGLSDAELVVRLEELDVLETVEMVSELSERWCVGALGDLRPVGVVPSNLQAGERGG